MQIKKYIPNALTCGNLLCGCLGIMETFYGNLTGAILYTAIALVLDFLDGFVARLLKVSSPIGKDLDSLADLVTFGVQPGFVMMHLLHISVYHDFLHPVYNPGAITDDMLQEHGWMYTQFHYFGLMIPLFSALRLAKFNNDTRQSDSFRGVPTPANTILIMSIPLMLHMNGQDWFLNYSENVTKFCPIGTILMNPYTLVTITVLTSFLLVADFPLIALKFKHFKWKGNEQRYLLIGISGLLLLFFGLNSFPMMIIAYIFFSVVNHLFAAKEKKGHNA